MSWSFEEADIKKKKKKQRWLAMSFNSDQMKVFLSRVIPLLLVTSLQSSS